MSNEKKNEGIIKEKNNIELYFSDVKKERLLTYEEELDITNRIKQGDAKAREQLIKSNIRFVITIAKQYQNSGLMLEDLISEGNIGLIIAADKFEPDKGYHFISYAVYWIRQSILKAINEKSRLIRLPLNKAIDLIKIERAVHQHYYNTGVEPNINKLVEILNKDPNDITNIMSMQMEHISLESESNFSNGKNRLVNYLEDKKTLSGEKEAINKELIDTLKASMSVLTETEANIIKARYGIDEEKKTLKEVGEIYNLTKERIRQIERKALRKMRHNKYSSLKDFIVN